MCVGVFEMDAFAKGTYGVAATLAELTGKGCITIIGGGGRSHHIALYRTISHHIAPYRTISHHITLYRTISHHITLYRTISHHITLYHTISHHIVPYYITSHCTMRYHITSCCNTSHHSVLKHFLPSVPNICLHKILQYYSVLYSSTFYTLPTQIVHFSLFSTYINILFFSSLLFSSFKDSVAAVEKAGLADKMSHISTGTYCTCVYVPHT